LRLARCPEPTLLGRDLAVSRQADPKAQKTRETQQTRKPLGQREPDRFCLRGTSQVVVDVEGYYVAS